LKILNEILGSKLRTIFTDDDPDMMMAMENFRALSNSDVAHPLCIWHKKINFSRQLSTPRATSAARDVADSLLDEMCYARSEAHVLWATEKLRRLIPTIGGYIDNELVPPPKPSPKLFAVTP
jgi:hypothetical protein